MIKFVWSLSMLSDHYFIELLANNLCRQRNSSEGIKSSVATFYLFEPRFSCSKSLKETVLESLNFIEISL